MANADSNMNIYSKSLADICYSSMAGALVNISFDNMELEECLLLVRSWHKTDICLTAGLGRFLMENQHSGVPVRLHWREDLCAE